MPARAGDGEPVLRTAVSGDVPAIRRFGAEHVPPHYGPLIGADAAAEQVRRWWNETHLGAAVAARLVVLADNGGELAGVGQRGWDGTAHTVYKLYVHPRWRGHGLGPRLLGALVEALPADADRLHIEHFAANERAGAFYEREGFTVDRIEPGPGGDPALGVVWRSRPLGERDRETRRGRETQV